MSLQRNPRVGYVQGHADVLCFVIGNINARRDEEEVFWVYASIIERSLLALCALVSATCSLILHSRSTHTLRVAERRVFPDDFFARAPKLHGFQVVRQHSVSRTHANWR